MHNEENNMEMSDKKRELLKKLQALAECGVGGEKVSAEKKLRELMDKYGVDEMEFLEQEKDIDFKFKCPSDYDKQLLRQIAYRMFGIEYREKMWWYSHGEGCKSTRIICCKQSEGIQLRIEYDFYRQLYYEELELFNSAFIQKHKLFSLRPEDGDDSEPTMEELERIMRMQQMMAGMQDKSLMPLLEEKVRQIQE